MGMTRKDGQASIGEVKEKVPKLEVGVSGDKMTAYLTVKDMPPEQVLAEKSVTGLLAEKGVTNGLCLDNIRRYCAGKNYSKPLVCAKGTQPEDEGEAKLIYLFRTDQKGLPVKRADGTVDYRNLEIVQNVKKGDVLCRIIPPPPGKDGEDVYGKPVSFRKCRLPVFPRGLHTLVSQDRMELSAAIDGCIDYRKNILNVNETVVVKGDVDNSSGNINFIGTVIVRGDVLEGFSVKAGGDISVYGIVEGATLQAAGNITVASGINGLSGGSISAGGNIESKYIQNATVRCGGDLYADVLMNSKVKAKQSVIMRGRKASIMGGDCCAGKQVYAKNIGTINNLKTDLVIDSQELYSAITGTSASKNQIDSLNREISKESAKQRSLRGQLDSAKRQSMQSKNSAKETSLMKSLLQRIRVSEKAVESYQRQISTLQKAPVSSVADFNVIGLKIIFAGTKITIGNCSITLNSNYNNTKFYIEKGQVISGPLLPSDEKML